MKDVKYSRYMGMIAMRAPTRIAKVGVWKRSLTWAKDEGITLSKDHARKSLLMKTRLSHDHPMFPMKSPTTTSHRSVLLGSSTVTKAVGTVGAPPPAVSVHASMNGIPTRLSRRKVS